MGGVFAANMTGNTVLAGIAAAHRDHVSAWHHLTPLVSFFVGAMLARMLLRLLKSPSIGILLEAILIAGVGFIDISVESAVMIVALAMGLQASTITSFGGSAVSTVVVTSTLARAADATIDRLWPGAGKSPPSTTNTGLLTLTWAGYLGGAIVGALLVTMMQHPLIVPALLLLSLFFLREKPAASAT